MREQARFWIAVSNREESMAHVLSRAQLYEGAILHAHASAAAALRAVLANTASTAGSAHCSELCAALDAQHVTPTKNVLDAAHSLDSCAGGLEPDPAGPVPSELATQDVATAALESLKAVRQFVNAALSR